MCCLLRQSIIEYSTRGWAQHLQPSILQAAKAPVQRGDNSRPYLFGDSISFLPTSLRSRYLANHNRLISTSEDTTPLLLMEIPLFRHSPTPKKTPAGWWDCCPTDKQITASVKPKHATENKWKKGDDAVKKLKTNKAPGVLRAGAKSIIISFQMMMSLLFSVPAPLIKHLRKSFNTRQNKNREMLHFKRNFHNQTRTNYASLPKRNCCDLNIKHQTAHWRQATEGEKSSSHCFRWHFHQIVLVFRWLLPFYFAALKCFWLLNYKKNTPQLIREPDHNVIRFYSAVAIEQICPARWSEPLTVVQ